MDDSSPSLQRALPDMQVGLDGERSFAEPWEARVFAIVVELSRAGHFSWGEWVECFSQEVAAASATEAAGGQPKSYYQQWLSTAETLLASKGLASPQQLAARRFAIGAVGTQHSR